MSAVATPVRSPRHRWAQAARWGLMAVCLSYLAWFFMRNRDTLEVAFSLRPGLLAGILLLQLVYYGLQGWRFRIVMEKCSGVRLPMWPWLRLFILGRFLNIMLSQAGNVYRSVRLKRDFGVSYTRYIGGFASMLWLDTCMNLLVAVAVILLFEPGFRIGTVRAWSAIAVLAVMVIVAPLAAERLLRGLHFRRARLDWVHGRLSEVLRITVANLHDPVYLLKIFGLGLLVFARTVWLFDLYFRAFGVEVPLPALAVFYTLFKLSFFVMLTPGNLGVQEIAWGFLSEQMGLGMARGVLMSAFIRVVGLVVIGVLGLACGGWDLLRRRDQLTTVAEQPDETGPLAPPEV